MSTTVRPMRDADVDAADRVTRLAFGTHRGLADPTQTFGESDPVRSRFRARPEEAWVAELDDEIVGAVFATHWGTFGWFGPLAVHPGHWDGGIASQLLEPVLAAFDRWGVSQTALFTFPDSPKHLGLYQKHGFWPGSLTAVMTTSVEESDAVVSLLSEQATATDELASICDELFPGLELTSELEAVATQAIGDTVLAVRDGRVEGFAICHRGPGSEATADDCYVKFGAVRPGADEASTFGELLTACSAFAVRSGAQRLVAGVNTARRGAYRAMADHGFRTTLLGVAMHSRPDGPTLDTPSHYVIDDLR
jgi:predicted N-acetyltransferase YhbS